VRPVFCFVQKSLRLPGSGESARQGTTHRPDRPCAYGWLTANPASDREQSIGQLQGAGVSAPIRRP
jgi:hypothetical protein